MDMDGYGWQKIDRKSIEHLSNIYLSEVYLRCIRGLSGLKIYRTSIENLSIVGSLIIFNYLQWTKRAAGALQECRSAGGVLEEHSKSIGASEEDCRRIGGECVHRFSIDFRQILDRFSIDFRQIFSRFSIDFRQIVDGCSIDFRGCGGHWRMVGG